MKKSVFILITIFLFVLQGVNISQENKPTSQKNKEKTLEDIIEIAKKRAQESLQTGKKTFNGLLPDLSLSWEENKEFVERAIEAVVNQGSDLAPYLLTFLDPSHPSEAQKNLASNVARILKRMGLDLIFPELLKLLKTGRTIGRMHSAILLGETNNKKAIEALRSALNDPSPYVISAAILSLTKLNDKEARKFLIPLLNKPDPKIRDALLRAFSKIGKPEDINIIIPAFSGTQREETILLLLNLIEKLGKGNKHALKFLIKISANSDLSLFIREKALELMKKIVSEKEKKEAINYLKKMIKDPMTTDTLKKKAAYILNDLGDSSGHKIVLGPADRFVRQNPKIPYAWVNRGDVYFRLKNYIKAAKDYLQAINLSRGKGKPRVEPHVWIQVFRCYALLGKYHDLVRMIKKSGLRKSYLLQALKDYPELEKACKKDKNVAKAFFKFSRKR